MRINTRVNVTSVHRTIRVTVSAFFIVAALVQALPSARAGVPTEDIPLNYTKIIYTPFGVADEGVVIVGDGFEEHMDVRIGGQPVEEGRGRSLVAHEAEPLGGERVDGDPDHALRRVALRSAPARREGEADRGGEAHRAHHAGLPHADCATPSGGRSEAPAGSWRAASTRIASKGAAQRIASPPRRCRKGASCCAGRAHPPRRSARRRRTGR